MCSGRRAWQAGHERGLVCAPGRMPCPCTGCCRIGAPTSGCRRSRPVQRTWAVCACQYFANAQTSSCHSHAAAETCTIKRSFGVNHTTAWNVRLERSHSSMQEAGSGSCRDGITSTALLMRPVARSSRRHVGHGADGLGGDVRGVKVQDAAQPKVCQPAVAIDRCEEERRSSQDVILDWAQRGTEATKGSTPSAYQAIVCMWEAWLQSMMLLLLRPVAALAVEAARVADGGLEQHIRRLQVPCAARQPVSVTREST